MAGDSDGIEEAFEAQLRNLLMAASRVGERLSRAREQSLRNAEASSQQEARELTSRLAAEKAAAVAQLRFVYQDGWWDAVTPQQLADTYQLARAWSGQEPEAAQAENRMREQLRERYQIDVDRLGEDPTAVQSALDARPQAGQEQANARTDMQEAATLMAAADAVDQHAESQAAEAEHRAVAASAEQTPQGAAERDLAGGDYDSAERREQFAQDLIAAGVEPDDARGRVLADTGRAEPAASSVGQGRARAPQASKARAGRGTSVQRTRPER